jgi:chemotaxis protein methyltransferase CheR
MTGKDGRAITEAAGLLAQRVGLQLGHSASGRLARCVIAAAQAQGLPTADYVGQLETDAVAFQDLLDRVTVQETAFFRDPGQFEALAAHVIPSLDAPATIWSAGCSNGQEAYSIAMLLSESGHTGSRILATDISTNAIARARRAQYSVTELKGLSAVRRSRHLRPAGHQFEVVSELRDRVDVAHHNLLSGPPNPPPESCAVVFCRNVLIYFAHDEIRRILDQLADWIGPDGWLFLGYSESLWQINQRFELVRLGNAFVYRPRGARLTAAPPKAGRENKATRRARRPRESGPPGRDTTPSATHNGSAGDGIVNFLELGRRAMQAGDHLTAVTAFRKSAYLDPDEPVAHLSLGLALEASGDALAARRAYAAARRALDTCAGGIEEYLGGYHVDELVRLLDTKLAGAR